MGHDVRDGLPRIRDLDPELTTTSGPQLVLTLGAPFVALGAYFVFATQEAWIPAMLSVMVLTFVTYPSSSHDLVHRNLGLPHRVNDILLRSIEILSLRSGTAYRLSHLHHHRRFPHVDDVEAASAGRGILAALLAGPTHQFRLWIWAWRTYPKHRTWLAAEAFVFGVVVAAALVSIGLRQWVLPVYVGLVVAGSWTFPLMTVNLPHNPEGDTRLTQTRLFRGWFYDLVALGHLYHLEHHLYPMVPHQHWRALGKKLDPYFAEAGIRPFRLL